MAGATCTASSVSNVGYECEKALTSGGQWASLNEPTGAWIKIQLSQLYYVSRIMVAGRCTAYEEQPKSVVLAFDNASTQMVCISTLLS